MRSSSRTVVVFAAALALAVGSARADVDIIDYLRKAPGGTNNWVCTLAPGAALAANSVYGIFDNDYRNDAGRLLIRRYNTAGKLTETYVDFTLQPDQLPVETGFLVKSIAVWRLCSGAGSFRPIERSPREWALEGSSDGLEWKTLYRTPEKVTWSSALTVVTNEIPASVRGYYRSYRLRLITDQADVVADSNNIQPGEIDDYCTGIAELQMFGEVCTGNLVWNGGDGETWNSSSYNWRGDPGAVTNWAPGAIAVFSTGGVHSVTLADTVKAGGIDLRSSAGNHYSIAGGKVELVRPATIIGGCDETIASAITNLSWEAARADSEWMPPDTNNPSTGASVLVWRNRDLSQITDFPSAKMYYSGEHNARAYNIVHLADGNMTAQFQVHPSSDRAVVCVKVAFEQRGADIYGRAVYAGYSWATDRALGMDFDGLTLEGMVYDGSKTGKYYGVRAIKATGVETPAQVKVGFTAMLGTGDYEGYLPASDTSEETGKAVTYWNDLRLDDVSDFSSARIIFYSALHDATAYHFKREGNKVTAQFQTYPSGSALFCFKVEFEQVGYGITARIVYVRYSWAAGRELGQDFDSPSMSYNTGKIHSSGDSTKSGYYGLRDIVTQASGRLTLAGALDFTGPLEIGAGGTLFFGQADLTLDRVITGAGAVGFTGTQIVRVGSTYAFNEVNFSGNTDLRFAAGTSIAAGSVKFGQTAQVAITAASGEKPLRIGTTKCLTKADFARFSFMGGPAVQDKDGYIVRAPGTIVILR